MIIDYYKLELLEPYKNNPRQNDIAVGKVAESIKEFGFKNPIIIDQDNVIIAGHTRYAAARLLGYSEVPVIKVNDLTPEQIKAFRIADNKVAEFSEWDTEALLQELEDLEQLGFDTTLTGFSEDEINDFFGGVDEKEQNGVEEDGYNAELPEEPVTKRGDIWQLGKHRLMCGDSTKANEVGRLMGGKTAVMVFTDPPYGVNYQSNMRTKTEKFEVLKNDNVILDFLPNVEKYSSGFVFICTTWKVLDIWLELFSKYFTLSNMIIWDKGGGGIGDLKKTFSTDYEVILVAHRNNEIKGKRIGSVWSIGKDSAGDYIHPTQKPVKLPALAIEETTNKNDIVLEFFGGSGSTLMACEQTDRICYAMELDEKYCDVIIKRWEDYTNEKAVLLNVREEK